MNRPRLPLNLKTNYGCCSPQPIPQDCDYTLTVPEATAILRFTRPPLVNRACCVEGELPTATPYFVLDLPALAFTTDDGVSYFASEDNASFIATED